MSNRELLSAQAINLFFILFCLRQIKSSHAIYGSSAALPYSLRAHVNGRSLVADNSLNRTSGMAGDVIPGEFDGYPNVMERPSHCAGYV